jgi:hypothetical protein
MKKSTVKAAKTPATAKKAPAKIVKKPAAAPVKRAAAPAVKASSSKASPTVITALIDVGFGNTLYVRGEGAGLSWNVGVPLDCSADDKWSISLPASGKSVLFKLLINDISWSIGPDYVVAAGEKVAVTPSF